VSPAGPRAFHLDRHDGLAGPRLALLHGPTGQPAQAAVLYLHPFAEELNRTRRMAALQSRRLATLGCCVLQLDLQGCGDSEGEFEHARWEDWLHDARQALAWLQARTGLTPWLWGLRSGALLAAQLAGTLAGPARLLLWQPVLDGALAWRQFLRARELGAAGAPGPAAQPTRVAGYGVHAEMSRALCALRLTPPPAAGQALWLDVSPLTPPQAAPAADGVLRQWQQAGWQIQHHTVPGPTFWSSSEIEEAPALLSATTDLVRPWLPA
jgi:exosortase A-associated hydrolase 2